MINHPITLALELSQREGSVAMQNASGVTFCGQLDSGTREVDSVFPLMDTISKELHIVPKEIELIAVSIGPGGFTGLRTAVAITKTLSFITHAKIISVETAIVIAHQTNKGDGPFIVLSGVKKNQFWLSRVQRRGKVWMIESRSSSIDNFAQYLLGCRCVFADDFVPKEAKKIIAEQHIELHETQPDAMALLEIGLCMYREGNSITPPELLPLYPREPEAVRLWNERHES